MTASYIPGTWLGVVRSGTAVLLGPESPAELAGALWELLGARPEPHEVLAAVTSSSGGSLASIPSFGILDFNGPLRVFLRGNLDLRVEQHGGAVDVDGRDVTTWHERRFAVPGMCRLVISEGGPGGQPELPLGEGVVLLQALTLGISAGPAAVAGPAARADGADPGHAAAAAPVPAPAGAGHPVPGPVVVDGAGAADATGLAGHTPAGPEGEPAAGPSAAAHAVDHDDLPGITLLPGHAVSDETLLAAVDGDQDFPESADADGGPGQAAGREEADPDATIAPGAIFPSDLAGAAGPDPEAGRGDGAAPDAASGPGAASGLGGEPDPDGEAGLDAESGLDGEPAEGQRGEGPGASPATASAVAEAPAVEMTTSYDHLWDRTVMRNIEDAAVREEPDADSGLVGASPQAGLPAGGQLAALGPAADAAPGTPAAAEPAGGEPDTGQDASGSMPPDRAGHARPGTVPGPAPEAESPAPSGVLIDSVPWRTASQPPAAAPAPDPAPGSEPPAASGQARGVGQAAGFDQATGFDQPGGFDPDHDGQTVMKSSLTGSAGQPAAAPAGPDPANGPMVLARVCAQGHPNPPTRAMCAGCGGALLPDAVQVARPRLGRVRLSTGDLLDLDQSMVIGRQPSVSRVQGGVMPRLVQVASPGGDISRSHVEVRLEGWHVMLCDLKATNGTVLVREGQPPRRLAQNEMAILLDGDIAELGDNISLRFEEIP